jgi:ribosomal protein S18 acetylase RimI-like enzyme
MSGIIRRTSMVGLRQGTPEDASLIAAIWHSGWRDGHLGRVPQELTEIRTEGSFRARAAERAAETVEQLYVSSSQRGRGIADALMSAAESRIRANGHAKGWLAVAPDNARARAFYERAGWRDEGGFDYEAAAEGGPIMVPCRRYVKAL